MTEPNIAFLEAADRIGSRLCRDAIFAGNRCNWIGASMEPVDGTWVIVQRTFGADLYAGTSGIALFLAHLAAQTNEPIHRRTAHAAVEHVRKSLLEGPVRTNIGFYSGSVGIAYALIDMDAVLPGEGLAELGLATLRRLPVTLDESTGLDVISGCAGAIFGLLALWRRHREAFLLEHAVRLGDRSYREGAPTKRSLVVAHRRYARHR
jgi:lantibiotic biosynthesis protein